MGKFLATTVIGSLPKPHYLGIPSWIENGTEVHNFIEEYNQMLKESNDEHDERVMMATKEVLDLQMTIGLTTLTDGELRRDKYINAFCRKLNGFDFVNTERKIWRNGAREGMLPKIVSKVSHNGNIGFLAEEWKWSQQMCDIPVKITIPGPMTILDTFCNEFYDDEKILLQDLIQCINMELVILAESGCKQIQVSTLQVQSCIFLT